MAIDGDFSIANDGSGNIRVVPGASSDNHTVLAFKNYLGEKNPALAVLAPLSIAAALALLGLNLSGWPR